MIQTTKVNVYMDTVKINPEMVELLSRITGKKLNHSDITPTAVFLTAFVTVMFGVIFIFADGTVTDDEKQRLKVSLNRLNLPEGSMRQLAKQILRGVQEQKIYRNLDNLKTIAASLTKSQKLLLMAFGYEMSAVDGEIDDRKQQYLQIIAKRLGIEQQHLEVLEAGFIGKKYVETATLDEVRYLLNPTRFQSLGNAFANRASNIPEILSDKPGQHEHQETQKPTNVNRASNIPEILSDKPGQHEYQENQKPTNVNRASNIPEILSDKPEPQETQKQNNLHYRDLKKFQKSQQELEHFCYCLSQIVQDCHERSFLNSTLIEELEKLSKTIQSHKFRLAVVGEFSQGKSTLLNALLGEEIQPVREIPCSGTVTILKYGTQKRVICRYKDGREEEISFNDYQLKATISEDAALGSVSDELANSQLEEIVFEHPDLELCRSGVEIVDSPGLNEHLERTTITQKLLKDTDAAIFLTNASRSLTQGERDLLQDLKNQLNFSNENEPANNLFVVGNFIDLVKTEKGREQVQQRIIRFVQGENSIVSGENRVHFISAQAALDAILQGNQDEYLHTFQNFTQSIEKFLTSECGQIKIQRSVNEINHLIQKVQDELHKAERVLDDQLNLSDTEKAKILEQIGEVSGRDVRIRNLANQLRDKVIEEAITSWNAWCQGLRDRMAEKSKNWSSKHNPAWSQDKLIQDYVNQFIGDLSSEIDAWSNTGLKDGILPEKLSILDNCTKKEFKAIKAQFINPNSQVNVVFRNQIKLSINDIDDDFTGLRGFGGGLGTGGALAAGLFVFTGVGLVPIIIASVGTAIASSLGLGMLDVDGLHDEIKDKVMEIGFQKFNESIEQVLEKIGESIEEVFDSRVESASEVIAEAITLHESQLEKLEKAHKVTLEECAVGKKWISQKRQEIEQIQGGIQAILQQSAK